MNVQKVDEVLLAYAQRLSDAIHWATGWDCLLQARICAGIMAPLWLIVIVLNQLQHQNFDWIAALLLASNVYLACWGSVEDAAIRSNSQVARNFRQISHYHRFERLLSCPLAMLLSWMPFPWAILLLIVALRTLFMACDVQKPGPGLREYLKSRSVAWAATS